MINGALDKKFFMYLVLLGQHLCRQKKINKPIESQRDDTILINAIGIISFFLLFLKEDIIESICDSVKRKFLETQ